MAKVTFTRVVMSRRNHHLLATILVVIALGAPPAAAHPDIPEPDRVHELRRQAQEIAPRVAAARARLDAAVAAYETGRTQLEATNQRVQAAEAHLEDVKHQLEEAQRRLEARAVTIYRTRRLELADALLSVRSFAEFVRVASLASAVVRADTRIVETVEALKEQASAAHEAVLSEREEQAALLASLGRRQADLMAQMREVANLLERVQQNLGAELGKFRFPVRPPYSYVDTFGAPRPGWRQHQGIDIFAPDGTPLVAVVGGTLELVGWNRLGGNRLWIRAPDGHRYYYAHLKGFAPGMRDGRRVEAGEVVGYNGKTGNAEGTPPHLHFEIHAPDGRVLNPFPILKEAERAWAAI